MTKKELIDKLEIYDNDACVVMSDGGGWANIGEVVADQRGLVFVMEKYPLFSES